MSDELDTVEERLLRAATRGFELESSVEVDDAARIDRLARQFEKRGRRAARPPIRRVALGVAAALLLVGTVVGAIQLTVGFSPSASPAAPSHAPPREAPPPPVMAPRATPRAVPAASAAPSPTPSASAPARAAWRAVAPEVRAPELPFEPAASEVPPPPAPPPVSAIELFSAANKARSRGDATSALALYARLQSEYPSAPEALAARISIGMLELQRGRASAALTQFRAYRDAQARSLRAEALWGEAEALRALGRSGEERAVLERLLLDHPASAYAPAARKRLGRD